MRASYIRLMDLLHRLCIAWCSISVVAMTVLIFTGVVMRYGFSTGARFAEPMSIFFTVQLTMYGAAACYRSNAHLRLTVLVAQLSERGRWLVDHLVHLLLAGVAIAMVYYGINLARTTWFQSYPEFRHIRVGVVYAAIPISGCIFLLFIVERFLFGPQTIDADEAELRRAVEHADQEERELATR